MAGFAVMLATTVPRENKKTWMGKISSWNDASFLYQTL